MTAERRSLADRIADKKKREEQLRAEVAQLEARRKTEERKRDTRRKIVVGGAVLAHAEHDPAFRNHLQEALRKGVTRDIDKVVVADLLGEQAKRPSASAKPEQPSQVVPA